MESFEALIETIKKPFLFLSKGSYSKISLVKDLRTRTISLAKEGLSYTARADRKEIFSKLISLFEHYESLTVEEKKKVVEESLKLLDGIGSAPSKSRTVYFSPEKHPLLEPAFFLANERKLSESVQFVKGVGPKIAEKFSKAGIYTIDDLLYFFPRKYEDRRKMKHIKDLVLDEKATFMATVKDTHIVYYRGLRRSVLEIEFEDETGTIKGKWFNFKRSYFEGRIKEGDRVILTGKVGSFKGKKEIHHPEFEIVGKSPIDGLSYGRIVPVYTEVGGIYQKNLRKIMYRAANAYSGYKVCPVPSEICSRHDLLSPSQALLEMHFPNKYADLLIDEQRIMESPCFKSLVFEELFIFSLLVGLKKRAIKSKSALPIEVSQASINRFVKALPFKLTASQGSVIEEIKTDLAIAKPMNRLLQGDVGSGKTVVALLSAMMAIQSGFQAAFMAPTEILALQVFEVSKKLLKEQGYKVELLVGEQETNRRKKVLEGIKDGTVDLAVGTHALIQEGVSFNNLGLIIVDEQHRFGVLQRSKLREKGELPHVLVMSATPIPRTLALTYYGDLDISTIREMPKGRKPIETRIVNDQARSKLYNFMRSELKKGRQAYVIYPIIEESSKVDLLDATTMYEYLSKNIFKDFNVDLIHGRMSGKEKDRIMNDFRMGKTDVLVSTTVIEVGIDVPNASVMVIEHPERFGLSQLHQLRGRVGRGEYKSFCFLLLGIDYEDEIKERLVIFKNTQDGFKLAEEDLRLRGPGDFFGVSQSGLPPFRLASFPRDLEILKETREEAFDLLRRDYNLKEKENSCLPLVVKKYWKDSHDLLQVG